MDKFSYTLEFYKYNIFNIDTDEQVKEIKKAVKDAKKIEEHFSSVLNTDLLRENIIISFYFNKELKVEDRINHIRGIAYSRRYINYRDIFSYYELLEIYFREGIETSICEDVIKNYKRVLDSIKNQSDEEKNILSFNDNVATDVKDDDTEEYTEDYEEDQIYNSDYIKLIINDILEIYKINFEEFKKIMLEAKNIPTRKNNRERKYVIMGMMEWYNYIINIFEELYNANDINIRRKSTDLSQYI